MPAPLRPLSRSVALAAAALLSSAAMAGQGSIEIDVSKRGPAIPRSIYGIFLEEISNSGEGGLYAELIQNRSFEDANLPLGCTLVNDRIVPPRTPHFWTGRPSDWTMPWHPESPHPAWRAGFGARIRTTRDKPLNAVNPTALELDATAPGASVTNDGFWGINTLAGERYHLTLHVNSDAYRGPLEARLVTADGRALASHRFPSTPTGGWRRLTATLRATGSDPKAKFELRMLAPGKVLLDHVSLFPAKTFKGRPNGLRLDLAEKIAALKPAFVRWPGGCVVEGISVDNRPRWEQTLGPVEARVPTYIPWGYWNSNGFGYHEWLQFCEDLGAEPLYVFNAGISCAFRCGTFLPESELDGLIQNALDAIEYAIGPSTSKWGALRAKNGHPKPFKMTTVEIGNEQQGPVYGARVARFAKAIRAKYPKMKIALSSWVTGLDWPAIEAAGDIDIVDEHAYRGLNWALANFDSFAKYRRDVPWKLYIGEFATNGGVGKGNLLAMLNDAVYMMSMERSSDLVTMGSYAPLLENVNATDWEVNLIRFDSSRSYGRGSYYACKLFADHLPTTNLASTLTYRHASPGLISGPIGLGTYSTAAEFRNLTIQSGGKTTAIPITDAMSGWTGRGGTWSAKEGVLSQTNANGEFWRYYGDGYTDATLRVQARKLSGAEGFLISVGNADGRRVQFNIGGWGNRLHAIQASDVVRQKPGSVETGRWYDVRIETRGRTIRAFLDDTLVFEETLPRVDGVFATAGLDEPRGDVVLKVVNAGPSPADLDLRIRGARELGREATMIVLSSDQPTDENSFEQPQKIAPRTSTIKGVGPQFRMRFQPYSLTLLRFPVKSR